MGEIFYLYAREEEEDVESTWVILLIFIAIVFSTRRQKDEGGSWRRLLVNRAIIRRFARDFRPNECRQPGQYGLTNIIPH